MPQVDPRQSAELFFIDTAGDHENLTYGSAYTRTVPSYFRAGSGGIIGLSRQTKIDRLASSDNSVVLSTLQYDLPRKRERLAFEKAEKKGLKTLRVKPGEDSHGKFDSAADFVSLLSSSRKNSHKDDGFSDLSASSDSNDIQPYKSERRIRKKVNRPINDDSADFTETLSSDFEGSRSQVVANEMQQRRKELVMNIEVDPTNCRAWMDLIDYQDTVLGINHVSARSKPSKAERQSLAEVKISIYEKAMEKVETSNDREILSLSMMEECHEVWESKKLSFKWQDILQKQPTSIALWTRYLNFRQSDFSSFKYEDTRMIFLDCLSVLRKARKSSEKTAVDRDSIYAIEVYVILRLTVFMREAGYSEHAIASWQAILEYIFFKPKKFQDQEYRLGGPLESTTKSAFGEFWESEVPRIGEEYSKGWSTYMSQKERLPEPKNNVNVTLTDCERIFDFWVRSERRRSLEARLPARTIDDLEENDPYRVILFSDVEDVLVDPPDHSGQMLLISAFLTFCHLPPFSTEVVDQNLRTWWRDSFFRNEGLYSDRICSGNWKSWFHTRETEIHESTDAQQGSALEKFDLRNPFGFFAPSYQLSHCSLMADRGSWFAAFDSWEDECFEDRGPIQKAWVNRTIKTLVQLDAGGENLAEYYLAFELRFSRADVRKTAKTLMKTRSSSVRLYNVYALIEYCLGHFRSGDNVFSTTINMAKTLDEQAQRDSLFLWTSWIWALLDTGQTAWALERLLMFANETLDANLSRPHKSLSQTSPIPDSTLLLRTQKV